MDLVPEFGLGTVVGFKTLPIASVNVVDSASCELEACGVIRCRINVC